MFNPEMLQEMIDELKDINKKLETQNKFFGDFAGDLELRGSKKGVVKKAPKPPEPPGPREVADNPPRRRRK